MSKTDLMGHFCSQNWHFLSFLLNLFVSFISEGTPMTGINE